MLYQILMLKNGDETVRKRFMSYAWTVAHGGVSLDEYETAYSSHIEPVGTVAETLEAIYVKFNTDRPEDYTGRSLSVSDLVMLDGVGAYFCDSFGFRKLDSLSSTYKEGNAMKTFDLGFGCLGNGTTVWDRNQESSGDYKTVAHIAAYGGVKLYDHRLKTGPEALRRIIDMAGRQQLDFYHWWFGQSYATQYSLFYESMTLRQQLAEHDDWPKEKSAEWMYQKYIAFACLNQGYTMPAELETR